MRRLVVIFGVALMVFAFVMLAIFIVAPAAVSSLDDAPLLRSILQAAVCHSDEGLTARYSTYSTPTSTTRSTDLRCVDASHNARDVSQQLIQAGMIGYFVPFLSGLFMSTLANRGKKKQADDPYAARESRYTDSEMDGQVVRRKDGITILNPSGPIRSQPHPSSEHLPLAQRLQELKDAYNAGLVTEAEYKARRQDLLKES